MKGKEIIITNGLTPTEAEGLVKSLNEFFKNSKIKASIEVEDIKSLSGYIFKSCRVKLVKGE